MPPDPGPGCVTVRLADVTEVDGAHLRIAACKAYEKTVIGGPKRREEIPVHPKDEARGHDEVRERKITLGPEKKKRFGQDGVKRTEPDGGRCHRIRTGRGQASCLPQRRG